MGIVVGLLVMVVLPAVLATMIAAWLGRRQPALRRWKQVALAAGLAGLASVTPGLILVWRAYRLTTLVPMAAVFALGLLIAALVGVPAALRATRSIRRRPDITSFD